MARGKSPQCVSEVSWSPWLPWPHTAWPWEQLAVGRQLSPLDRLGYSTCVGRSEKLGWPQAAGTQGLSKAGSVLPGMGSGQ